MKNKKLIVYEIFDSVRYCVWYAWKTSGWYTFSGLLINFFEIIIPFWSLFLSKKLLDAFANIASVEQVTILRILFLTFFASVTNIVLSKTGRYIQSVHNDMMENMIQMEFMSKNMTLDLEFFDNPIHADVMQAARMDASAIPNVVWSVVSVFKGMMSFVMSFAVLGQENWLFAVVITMSGIPFAYYNQKYAKDIYKWRLQHISEERKLSHIQMLASSKIFAGDIRVFGICEYLIEQYRKICDRLLAGKKQKRRKQLTAISLSSIIPEVCAVVIVIYITDGIISGKNTLGDYTLYTGLLSALITSVTTVISGLANIYENKLKIDTIKKFKEQKNHVTNEGKICLERIEEIEFRNVSFRYPNTEREILKDVSFIVHQGERICLVGANGAGKSTIIKLILRFYDVSGGQILINGIDIKEYTLESVRNGFSTIFQQYDKMGFSLKENIMLSDVKRKGNQDAGVIEALKLAGGESILDKINYNLDVPLSRLFDSNGLELSGGEMQKIGLARAIYRLRTAVIFDEPTSALDPVSETKLFERLQVYLEGKTTIFTTHRMNTVHLADKIIVVKEGYVCENGTHSELLKLNGIYAELFRVQAEKFMMA